MVGDTGCWWKKESMQKVRGIKRSVARRDENMALE
jgi:hypothetical protein